MLADSQPYLSQDYTPTTSSARFYQLYQQWIQSDILETMRLKSMGNENSLLGAKTQLRPETIPNMFGSNEMSTRTPPILSNEPGNSNLAEHQRQIHRQLSCFTRPFMDGSAPELSHPIFLTNSANSVGIRPVSNEQKNTATLIATLAEQMLALTKNSPPGSLWPLSPIFNPIVAATGNADRSNSNVTATATAASSNTVSVANITNNNDQFYSVSKITNPNAAVSNGPYFSSGSRACGGREANQVIGDFNARPTIRNVTSHRISAHGSQCINDGHEIGNSPGSDPYRRHAEGGDKGETTNQARISRLPGWMDLINKTPNNSSYSSQDTSGSPLAVDQTSFGSSKSLKILLKFCLLQNRTTTMMATVRIVHF